jgi:hypothetical protein
VRRSADNFKKVRKDANRRRHEAPPERAGPKQGWRRFYNTVKVERFYFAWGCFRAFCILALRKGNDRDALMRRAAAYLRNRLYFLASGWNPAIQPAISHGNMAQKAVRWQPGHKARLLTRFRRNQPENHHYVATRFFYASVA